MKPIGLTFIVMMFVHVSLAQCTDSLNFPNLQPPCWPDFIPVCGCDGVTYRNSCYADYATVLQYQERPCEQVALDIYPNPSSFMLFATVVTKFDADVNLYIFDRNGMVYYYQYLTNVSSQQVYIPVQSFEPGLYIIMAESNGVAKLLKFLKWDE